MFRNSGFCGFYKILLKTSCRIAFINFYRIITDLTKDELYWNMTTSNKKEYSN